MYFLRSNFATAAASYFSLELGLLSLVIPEVARYDTPAGFFLRMGLASTGLATMGSLRWLLV
jgi:hypothetical protein